MSKKTLCPNAQSWTPSVASPSVSTPAKGLRPIAKPFVFSPGASSFTPTVFSPPKKDESKMTGSAKVVPKLVSEPKKEEPKQEEPKQEEPKQEEPKQEEPKQEEPKQEEPKQEEPKQGEPKQEEPKQEELLTQEPTTEKEKPQTKEPKKEITPETKETKPARVDLQKKEIKPARRVLRPNVGARRSFSTKVTAPAPAAPVMSAEELEKAEKLADDTCIYSRLYLLTFREACRGLPPPANLDTLLSGMRSSGGNRGERGRGYNRPEHSGGRNTGRRPGGGRQRPGRNTGRTRQVDKPIPGLIVKDLTTTEKGYKMGSQLNLDEENKFKREIASILNKLTPEKFEVLVTKMMALKSSMTSPSHLKLFVVAVFEKSLAEPIFAPTYAKFCSTLQKDLPTFKEGEKELTFKRSILNQCQGEFEKDQVQGLTESETTQQKKRMLGLMRFIGELYIRRMVAASIMRHCLGYLLGNVKEPNEESIEALTKLLCVVGAQMDSNPQMVSEINILFAQLKALSGLNEKISSRLRFMLMDLFDLRKNRWKGRQKKIEPKNIKALHAEQAAEEEKANRDAQRKAKYASRDRGDRRRDHVRERRPLPPQNFARKGDRYGALERGTKRPPSPKPKRKADKDGWTTNAPMKGQSRKGDSRARAPPPSSKGDGKGKKPPAVKRNVFDLLGGSEEDEDNSDVEEAEEAEEMDEEQLLEATNKIRAFLREYFNILDFDEASLCLKDVGKQSAHHLVVSEGILLILDAKDKEREATVKNFEVILKRFVTEETITVAQLEQGFKFIMQTIGDRSMDAPLIWKLVPKLLLPYLISGEVSFDFVNICYEENPENQKFGYATKFAISVCKAILAEASEDVLTKMYVGASWKFLDIMRERDATEDGVQKALSRDKLDFLANI